MNRKSLFVTLLLTISLVCIALILSSPIVKSLPSADPHHPLHILFIGNSYTFGNNLPRLVSALAASADRPVTTEMVTQGGMTLAQHWQDGQTLAAIRRGGWDYVVLQEHSTFGSTTVVDGVTQLGAPDDFLKYARLFDAQIKKIGAKTIFFLTWARKNAPQNQAILNQAYLGIAEQLHALVAPVGIAWASAMQARPGLVLHQPDMSHPNRLGSYLAACVFYATIYHKSPVGLAAHIADAPNNSPTSSTALLVDLSKPDATFLQTIAWKTVLETSEPLAANVGTPDSPEFSMVGR